MNYLICGKYPIQDFYDDVDRSALYLLNLSFREEYMAKRIYELIKDKVRENALNIQSHYPYHINDTHIAHALSSSFEEVLEKAHVSKLTPVSTRSLDAQIQSASSRVADPLSTDKSLVKESTAER